MSYQPPAGMPPQTPPGPAPFAPPPAPAPLPVAPPPGPASLPAAAAPLPVRRSAAALTGAVFGLLAVVLLVVAVLGHTWLRPEKVPDAIAGGHGLWSTVMEGQGHSFSAPLSDMVAGDRGVDEGNVKTGLFAYGSMAFFVVNWILIVLLLAGTALGFARWAAGKPAGVPFALTLIPGIVAVIAFLAWFGVAVLLSEALDGMDVGGMVFLWWAGVICVFVAAILFAKVRSARAFGAGFQGSGAMSPPGAGTVGAAMLPPGQGTLPNPADTIGRPQG